MKNNARTKILLVQLYGPLQPPNWEPFSCEVLAGAIEKHCKDSRVDIMVVNPLLNANAEKELLSLIIHGKFDIVGISIPQATYGTALDILRAFEESIPLNLRPLVVLGNTLPTNAPDAFLTFHPWTIVVKGWGEDSLIALIYMLQNTDTINLAEIPNIAFMQNGEIHLTLLKYQVVPEKPRRYRLGQYFACIETSRGCHYGRCTFCLRPPGRKDYWSRLPLEGILDSVTELKKAGINYFTFVDEDFIGNDLDGALAIALGLHRIGGMNFSFSVRADNFFDPKATPLENKKRLQVFQILHDAGLRFVFIGLESLSSTQLKRYGKGNTVWDSVKAIHMVKSLGIIVETGFIMFDPFMNLQELQDIASVLRTSNIWENVGYFFSHMRVQKNTPYEIMLAKKGMLKEFDPNMLIYDWDYADKIIGAVAKTCISWGDEIVPIYVQVRNLERTKKDFKPAVEFMRAIRYLNLEVLEHVIDKVNRKDLEIDGSIVIEPHLRERIYNLARNLLIDVSSLQEEKGDAEQLLLHALKNYLSNASNKFTEATEIATSSRGLEVKERSIPE